ncbi:NAD(P)-binding protein [Hymenopellis radicata]|nr:NAD(P)-binding protein [Hymenopellis radicata]
MSWTAVITSRAVQASAQAFANNGARAYVTGRRAVQNLVHEKGKFIAIQSDVSEKGIRQSVERVKAMDGHVDVLVNNAGIMGETSEGLHDELWRLKEEDWLQYKTNVVGHFFTATVPVPMARGRFINISSMSGITSTTQHHPQYNVLKAASIQLTPHLAQKFKRPGISVRVNIFAPGIFPSQMTAGSSDKSEIPTEGDYGAKKGIPAGQHGAEDDMAQAALQPINTCTVVTVDGGYLLVHG